MVRKQRARFPTKPLLDRLLHQADAMGHTLLHALARLLEHPHVGDVRGRGLMAGVEIVADKDARRPFPRSMRHAEAIGARAFDHGLVDEHSDASSR